MVSTFHNETMVKPSHSRGRPALDGDTKLKPRCVVDYNNNMGSMDRQDAIIKPYSAGHKSMKTTSLSLL